MVAATLTVTMGVKQFLDFEAAFTAIPTNAKALEQFTARTSPPMDGLFNLGIRYSLANAYVHFRFNPLQVKIVMLMITILIKKSRVERKYFCEVFHKVRNTLTKKTLPVVHLGISVDLDSKKLAKDHLFHKILVRFQTKSTLNSRNIATFYSSTEQFLTNSREIGSKCTTGKTF